MIAIDDIRCYTNLWRLITPPPWQL